MFDKSPSLFPIKERYAFLSHCGIAAMYGPAQCKEHEIAELHCRTGTLILRQYQPIMQGLHAAAAELLKTSPDNVAFIRNTSEGIGLIAAGYPFKRGDQVISYVHEYPANYYPWKLQERRGVELVLLPDRDTVGIGRADLPVAFTMRDLEERVTPRTRVVALSHVQFASGHIADVAALSEFCKARGIDLVLDVAQSLGALPFYPEELNVAAAVSSGWKWLMGPIGTGLLYTSPAFREKLELVMVGADTMQQGDEYLDHTWAPHMSAKIFEYSTVPIALAAALECCIREMPLRYGLEAIWAEVTRLQDVFLARLDSSRFRLVFDYSTPVRSPIISLVVPGNAEAVAKALVKQNVICTARGGYLRVAPHFHNTEAEVERAADALNAIA
jgi:cysteine desulfurase/selenocysteine lyase